MEKIKPLGDRIIVKPIVPNEKTPGGVILMNPANQTETSEGIIIDIGPGRRGETASGVIEIPINLKVGDKVLFSKGVGAMVESNGEKHRIIRESDVIGVYETV